MIYELCIIREFYQNPNLKFLINSSEVNLHANCRLAFGTLYPNPHFFLLVSALGVEPVIYIGLIGS